MELNKDVPSSMHYCLYCIARDQNRKKSDYLILFFFFFLLLFFFFFFFP